MHTRDRREYFRQRHQHKQATDPEYRKRAVERCRERRQRLPNCRQDEYYKRTFGISFIEFDAMFETQGRLCGVCGSTVPNGNGWAVDHCHKTGRVRGILCGKCNVGGGMFNDDPALLQKAVEWFSRT